MGGGGAQWEVPGPRGLEKKLRNKMALVGETGQAIISYMFLGPPNHFLRTAPSVSKYGTLIVFGESQGISKK